MVLNSKGRSKMKIETPEQEILYLKQEIAMLKQKNDHYTRSMAIHVEYYKVNLQKIAEKLEMALLSKRPCDKCQGAGKIVVEKWVDPRASKDCTPGANQPESTPCMDCDTIGTVWK